MKLKGKFAAITLAIALTINPTSACAFSSEDLKNAEKSAVAAVFGEEGGYKFTESFLQSAGSSACDWFVIGLSRLKVDADYASYKAALEQYIIEKYETDDLLDAVKATEWHRASLAYLACGGNPTDIGGINLALDGLTLRDFDKQGLSAYIWGLIAANSSQLEAEDRINEIINHILSCQLNDGGFTLFGEMGDVDVTAMVLTALAPFAERAEVAAAIEGGVQFLATAQLESGGFASYGVENCESLSQVIVALCSLGINPQTDGRFVKNDLNLVDFLLKYEIDGVGFSHLTDTNEINVMASYQALLALAALDCYNRDERLYEFDLNSKSETLTVPESSENSLVSTESPSESESSGAENKKGNDVRKTVTAAFLLGVTIACGVTLKWAKKKYDL